MSACIECLTMSVSIFFSYSHKDEALRDKVAEHLSALKRNKVIQAWHDRMIPVGSEWKDEIDRNLNTADIILLLVSASFLSSEYCWSLELERAMARHEAGDACVIPVILRPCDWEGTPFAKLQMLPKDAKAVTSWSNEDEALTNVAQGIRGTVKQVAERKTAVQAKAQKAEPKAVPQIPVLSVSLPKSEPEDELKSEKGVDYAPLQKMLQTSQWKKADQETWRVMCAAMGRQKEGYLLDKDIKQFPCADLRTIDQLWVKYSKGKWGFSVQKRIWQECGSPMSYNDDWKKFGDRVGWRKEGNWLSYDNLTFDLDKSLTGEFPRDSGVNSLRFVLVHFLHLGSLFSHRDL